MQIIKLNRIKPMVSKYEKYFAPSAAIMFCILSLLTIQPVSLPQKIAQATIDPTAYAITLTTDSDFSLNLQPNLTGEIGVAESLVTINAKSPSGFKLYLSTSGEDNNIYLGGADSGESSEAISATTGTIAFPAALSANSWGVAVAGQNGFDTSYADPSASSKFAAVPTAGNEAEIYTHATATSGDKDISVYFGVQADLGIETGNYPMIINYYTITEVTDQPSGGEAVITPARAEPRAPQNIEITTSLSTDRHLGTVTATIGSKSCTNVTVSKQNPLTFTCDIPTDLTVGTHAVEINAGGIRNYTIPNGFEIKVECNPVATTIATGASTDAVCMQDLNQSVLDAIDAEPVGTQYSLLDSRDGKAYYFAKQADGNIWMTQNLDLDLDATVTYKHADTDLGWTNGDTTATWTPGEGITYPDGESANTIVGTDYGSSTWTNDNNTPYSWDPGHYQILDSYSISSACTNKDFSKCTNGVTPATSEGEANHYHVGNLYNWSAAVATNDTSAKTTEYEIMPDSICPAGWKLPNGMTGSGTTGMYSKLLKDSGIVTAYSTNTSSATWSTSPDGKTLIFQDPLYLVRGGNVYSSSVTNVGTLGNYWSSSVNSSSSAYRLYFNSSNILPQDYLNRYYGISVRCVARTHSITYDANGGTGNSAQTVSAPSGQGSVTATLRPTIPTRDGYNFLGFATSPSATTPDYTYSNGSFSLSTITISENTTLYAVWEKDIITFDKAFAAAGKSKVTATDGQQYFKMQDMTSTICNNVFTGVSNDGSDTQTTQLVDTRDGKTYWVSKLKDGNCWMTQNLDFNIIADNTYTPADTDIPLNWKPVDFNTEDTYTDDSWYYSHGIPESYDPGDRYWDGNEDPNWGITIAELSSSGNKHYHIGNYYNWPAALAGVDFGQSVYDQSICPAGWTLPKGGDDNQFTLLLDTYSIDDTSDLYGSPLYFVLGGSWLGDTNNIASDGYYWTSTVGGNLYASAFYFSVNGGISLDSYGDRYNGYSVRCLAR